VAEADHADDLTPDRVELMAELARLAFEASRLAAPLDEERFNWQPEPGKSWSVGQCLEHLVRSNRLYLDAMEDVARAAAKAEGHCDPIPLDPGRLGRWFVGEMEPPPKRRMTSPKKSQPPSMCMKEATLVAFAGEQQRIIEFVRETACLDCNEIQFKNPFLYGLRVFNLATGLLVLAAHERRHLWQAAQVVERMARA
jgi:hypothetical protein